MTGFQKEVQFPVQSTLPNASCAGVYKGRPLPFASTESPDTLIVDSVGVAVDATRLVLVDAVDPHAASVVDASATEITDVVSRFMGALLIMDRERARDGLALRTALPVKLTERIACARPSLGTCNLLAGYSSREPQSTAAILLTGSA